MKPLNPFGSLTHRTANVMICAWGIGLAKQFSMRNLVVRLKLSFDFHIRNVTAVLSFLVLLFVACSAEASDRRVAFVVGNGDYKSVALLPNPKNDADAVAAALKRQGFEVVTAIDIDRVTFDKAFEKFVRSMDNADLSVFYYSGHGIQVNGENRIIPVDAKLANPADLEIETVSVQTIMSYMRTNSKVQLVYLDSCRNNPFPSQSFLVGPEKQVAVAGVGLAPLANSLGSLVAFSTQPGAVAVDGTGDKSPFTESMLRHSFKLGVDAQKALDNITKEVFEATKNRQKPWSSNSLAQPVYLAKPIIQISALQPANTGASSGVKIGSAVTQNSAAAQSAPDTSNQIATLLQQSFSRPQRVPIGVGQVAMLVDFPIIRAATGAQIEISSAPKSGIMYLDGKPLGAGDVLDDEALRKITFEPSIGSEDKVETIELKVSQAGTTGAIVNGQVEPFIVACDNEAGEPLDLQGVATGKLPNEIDPVKAVAACQDAVQTFPNLARYKYELGRAKLAAKDVPAALDLFNKAAEAGHTRAFYQLGYIAQRGLGRKQDIAEANRLFKVGSDLGDPYAMLAYGYNLSIGRSIEKNLDDGVRLMNRAVEFGHTYAMNALGSMYYNGEGLKQNPSRGVTFYRAAMARGDIYAMRNLGLAYRDGKGVKKDLITAMALFKKASGGGHPSAPNDIGILYLNGNGVKKDMNEAIKWYELGAERGDFWAASNLAWVYSKGPNDRRDSQKAASYSGLSVALDVYKMNAKEKSVLKAMPADAKKLAIKNLVAAVGADNIETGSDLDETLVMMSRKAWQLRNPRLDLF